MEHNIETEQDLQRLLGQFESIRLEFKASALLAQPTDRIVKQLTEEVSAFANTEGGMLIIGISEGKSGRKSVAVEIDEGVDPVQMPPEKLEQLIASNISPPVPGLTLRPIPLSGQKAGRVAFAVAVPKGSTAYQARHSLLYYGRTEFAAAPLHDNVIRLLMTRGTVAHAVIESGSIKCRKGEERAHPLEVEKAAPSEVDKWYKLPEGGNLEPTRAYYCRLNIRNDGPRSIEQCLLTVSMNVENIVSGKRWTPEASGDKEPYRFPMPFDDPPDLMSAHLESETLSGDKLYPGQVHNYPGAKFLVYVSAGAKAWRASLEWTLFLDDAPPVSSSLDLLKGIAEHQKKANASPSGSMEPQ